MHHGGQFKKYKTVGDAVQTARLAIAARRRGSDADRNWAIQVVTINAKDGSLSVLASYPVDIPNATPASNAACAGPPVSPGSTLR